MPEPTNALVKVRGGGYPNDEATIPQLFAAYQLTNLTQFALIFNVPGTLSVANDVCPWVLFPFAYTLIPRCYMALKTLPTTTNNVSFDIKRSVDNGASFTSILTTQPFFAPGIVNSKVFPIADFGGNTSFNAGDVLRLDILTVGDTVPGADLMVALNGFIPTPGV